MACHFYTFKYITMYLKTWERAGFAIQKLN